MAESGAGIDEAVAEGPYRRPFLCAAGGHVPSDLLGVGDEMGEADLPVHSNPGIGGIAIAHQDSAEVLSEDAFCHLGRPMSIDMKEARC